MTDPTRPRMRLGTQILVLTGLLVAVVVVLCTVASVFALRRDLTAQYEQRALAVARSVATDPDLARQVVGTKPSPMGPVERSAEAVRRSTGSLYVVVTDDRGIRYSHPTRSEVGRRVSTSPDAALAGHDVVTVQTGTLGRSARGKVPLRDAAGKVVGEVSVGIDIAAIDKATRALAIGLGLIALVPLSLGLAGAISLSRRLRRTTLGLEPEQMADLVREHEAVLHGVTDGVLAVDTDGRVTVSNPEAERLLGHVPPRGEPLAGDVDPALTRLMTADPPPRGVLRVVNGRAVLATRLPVRRGSHDLGQVLTLRDRSDLDTLARELEATRALSDALRAQAHEYTNRLHTLTGLLHRDHVDEAREYLDELALAHSWVAGVDDPYLAGLLAAKSAIASESAVSLDVAPETFVAGRLVQPLETVTVIGNLIDNAIRAAADGGRRPARVEVALLSDGADLVVSVEDSGDGVPAEAADSVFDHGWSSRAGETAGHGLGLSLARHTARATGGDIVLRSPGGRPPEPHGARFEARLGGVVGAVANGQGAS